MTNAVISGWGMYAPSQVMSNHDLEKLVEASRLAERIIGRPLNGHLMHSGTLAAMRG